MSAAKIEQFSAEATRDPALLTKMLEGAKSREDLNFF
jgi:hypothetical protein